MVYEYRVELYRVDSLCGESEFWRFMDKHNGGGFSQSWKDSELLGKNYSILIESDTLLTKEDLQKDLHSVSIVSIGLLESKVNSE